MPAGTSFTRPIRWPSREFLGVYDDVCKRLGTTAAARLIDHAMADIERDGTPDEKALAREHLEKRPRPGPKPKASKEKEPAPADPADELRKWKQLADDGVITPQEWEEKKARLLA